MRDNSDISRWPLDKQDRAQENFKRYKERMRTLVGIVGKKRLKKILSKEDYDTIKALLD
jgi:hypothetical protein